MFRLISFFLAISIAIGFLLPDISWNSYFALLIFISQILFLFHSIGSVIPIRSTFGLLMSLQMLFGPAVAYNWLNKISTKISVMAVPENIYFGYVTPAVLCFLIGLNLKAINSPGEKINIDLIAQFIDRNQKLPIVFIVIGFFSSFLSSMFSSYLAFVFVLLGGFKFIGLFMLITGNLKLKFFPLILIIFSIFSSSLSSGMFHDLLIWLIFIGAIVAIKYKPSIYLKTLTIGGFLILSVVIQQLKTTYRESIWQKGEEGGIETFVKAYNTKSSIENIFSYNNLQPSVARINQGYIIANIMITVPTKIPFSEGEEMLEILKAAIFPRFLIPDKLTSGNQELFMKYTGIQLNKTTSMGLSSVGDAYINYGVFWGGVFMFFLGLLYNSILKHFDKYKNTYPVLVLFTVLVFYYPVRPDCELQTILGHLVKSCFVVYIIFRIFNNFFRIE